MITELTSNAFQLCPYFYQMQYNQTLSIPISIFEIPTEGNIFHIKEALSLPKPLVD